MKTITPERVAEIYEEVGANISTKYLSETADGCNENAANGLHNLSAEEWCYRWAHEEAHEQECEARDYDQFHHDAYGDD